jgi:hypothetical protein
MRTSATRVYLLGATRADLVVSSFSVSDFQCRCDAGLFVCSRVETENHKSRFAKMRLFGSNREDGEMANKQSIQDVDEALDRWHRRLNICVTKINELRDKRKRLIKGYIKHPPPKGVKVMLSKATLADFDDTVPSFPAIGG